MKLKDEQEVQKDRIELPETIFWINPGVENIKLNEYYKCVN